jgi:hypothetical protein
MHKVLIAHRGENIRIANVSANRWFRAAERGDFAGLRASLLA